MVKAKKKKSKDFQKVKLKVGKKLVRPQLTDTAFTTRKLTIASRFTPQASSASDAVDVKAAIEVGGLSLAFHNEILVFCRSKPPSSFTPTRTRLVPPSAHCASC